MSHRNALLLIAATLVCYACYVRAEQNPYAKYVAAGFSVIDRWSLEHPPDQELFDGAMEGMVQVLEKHGDLHSQFIEAQKKAIFSEDLLQEFGGVGIRLRALGEPSFPTVIGPPEPGAPAYLADIRSGDRIVAIDGKTTADVPLDEIVKQVRGPIGSPVVLTIMHEGETETHEVSLDRAVIMVPSILGDRLLEDGTWSFQLESDPQIGYVRITKFGDKTVEELREVLAKLTAAKIKSLILDLRDNHGGALDAAVEICEMFLPVGMTIVSTRGRNQEIRERYVTERDGPYQDLPLAVIINHYSASASEIVAACLQDHRRALVVGERSYGKGTVQRVMRLESGRSLLKLTTASFWRPSEKNIHKMTGDTDSDQWGVKPNPGLEVELDEKQTLIFRLLRNRRDVPGDLDDSLLIKKLGLKPEDFPEKFTDKALDRAVEALKQQNASTLRKQVSE